VKTTNVKKTVSNKQFNITHYNQNGRFCLASQSTQ